MNPNKKKRPQVSIILTASLSKPSNNSSSSTSIGTDPSSFSFSFFSLALLAFSHPPIFQTQSPNPIHLSLINFIIPEPSIFYYSTHPLSFRTKAPTIACDQSISMTRLFRSKSSGLLGLTQFNPSPSLLFPHSEGNGEEEAEEEDEEEFEGDDDLGNPISTPSSGPVSEANEIGDNNQSSRTHNQNQFPILDILVAALRKSLVTCSVGREDVSSIDISWPTDVRHVSHVTFDKFNGFLGLPTELEPEVPRRAPSASASVFGVSAKSMQCSYDDRGNSIPTILLMMQKRLYAAGGLEAEGIFRINAENSQEEFVRNQLNRGAVPHGIDVHCLSGLIKAWFRELPSGVLDSLTPEQVMHCNTEDDCTQLVKLLPPIEAALLDWAINLMADVVRHEQFNKMNARNIAMVFAPNMTQMADPLTALIHAVQVMNFLRTLILMTLREREELGNQARLLSSSVDTSTHRDNAAVLNSCERPADSCYTRRPTKAHFLRSSSLGRWEWKIDERLWGSERKSSEEWEFESASGGSTPPKNEIGASENGQRGRYDAEYWISLRKGMRKLCRHPVFHLSKQPKKAENTGIVNARDGDGEAWA